MSVFTSLWNFQAFYPGTLKPRQVRGTLPLVYWGSHWWWITSFLLDLHLEWESELTKHQEQYCSSTAASWRLDAGSCTHSLPLSLPVPGVWPLDSADCLLNRYFHVWQGTEVLCSSCFSLRCVRNRVWFWSCLFWLKMWLEQKETWKLQLPIHHLLPSLNPCWQPHDLQGFLRKWKPLMTPKAHGGCERHLGPRRSALERFLTWQSWQSPFDVPAFHRLWDLLRIICKVF